MSASHRGLTRVLTGVLKAPGRRIRASGPGEGKEKAMTTMTVIPPADEGWFKSSFSQNAAGCVEVRFAAGLSYVRSTRDRGGPMVTFTRVEWEAFLLGAWNGEFDMPA
ncbi:DUF397 domain-containing protein [Streptomyces malaysiensis]|uniref:DUF397 domain-containing protein n=1 Tax=Streptomyces malaysiensis TaxID=92644 RepID=UPI0024BFBE07|nr:DUF397 domain-containing protein [Streptomyces sp. NA07423]MCC4322326.1 DUF397 domain-containing protein [Streptomyces malaysiensis]WHX21378.1 DUF397 domain-containing protein [Streptomyces sp. NA07423]